MYKIYHVCSLVRHTVSSCSLSFLLRLALVGRGARASRLQAVEEGHNLHSSRCIIIITNSIDCS
jgi:hypothetical protein